MRTTRFLFMTGCALLLSGCFDLGLSRETPQQRRYVLEAPRAEPAPGRGRGHLEVRAFHAAGAYAGRSFVYRVVGQEVESDYYHEFQQGPGQAVSEVTRAWLAASGIFATVRGGGSRVAADLILEGDVLELYGDYREATAAAVLSVEFTLIDRDRQAVIYHETLSARSYLPDQEPANLVAGWNGCLAEILVELEAGLRGTPGN